MKPTRLQRRLLVFAFVFAAALAVWWVGDTSRSRHQPCKPERIEERDASGKVVKITNRTCY